MAIEYDFLLLETGSYLLLEDGGKIIIAEREVEGGGLQLHLRRERQAKKRRIEEDFLTLLLIEGDDY